MINTKYSFTPLHAYQLTAIHTSNPILAYGRQAYIYVTFARCKYAV